VIGERKAWEDLPLRHLRSRGRGDEGRGRSPRLLRQANAGALDLKEPIGEERRCLDGGNGDEMSKLRI